MKKIFSDNNLLDDANDNATTIMPIFAEVEGNPDIECPGVAEVDLPILPAQYGDVSGSSSPCNQSEGPNLFNLLKKHTLKNNISV